MDYQESGWLAAMVYVWLAAMVYVWLPIISVVWQSSP
jgi:hypothetical protein